MSVLCVSDLIILFIWMFVNEKELSVKMSDSSDTHQHRTKAASEKQNDLWCHRCDSMLDGDNCLNVSANVSALHVKCPKEQRKCQVRRISMSTSTEEVTGTPKLWLLQRNCTETCDSGCIVIGERTKLHSCITCCDDHNFCNSGNSANGLTLNWMHGLEFIGIVSGKIIKAIWN